tara:strand:- start:540 stop:902 length:363 start_codon:yes stop_codon:yes gene_type:complete
MAGNYGGSSIPTTPIGGTTLYDSRNTTYKTYACTGVVASATTATFQVGGVTFNLGEAENIDLLLNPGQLTAAPVGVYFLCYDCSCLSIMSGITAPSAVNYSGASSDIWKPTIIGNGGQNS